MTTIKGNEKKNKDPQNITPVFHGFRVVHLFMFLCCVICFVFLRLVKIAMSSFVIELGVKMTIDVNNFWKRLLITWKIRYLENWNPWNTGVERRFSPCYSYLYTVRYWQWYSHIYSPVLTVIESYIQSGITVYMTLSLSILDCIYDSITVNTGLYIWLYHCQYWIYTVRYWQR
jgi:hypothetical protein